MTIPLSLFSSATIPPTSAIIIRFPGIIVSHRPTEMCTFGRGPTSTIGRGPTSAFG
ncbi:unnamed protein product, partial [Linum tenue]